MKAILPACLPACLTAITIVSGAWSQNNVAGVHAAATTGPGMVRIAGGTFRMGQPNPDLGGKRRSFREQPVHAVTVSPFFMDSTPVTQGEYQALLGVNPSCFTGDMRRPVERVSAYDAMLYCNARSKADGFDTVYSYRSVTRNDTGHTCIDLPGLAIDYAKHGYRLPTEAEWEYACRAGTTTDYYWGKKYPPVTQADTLAMDSNAVWHHNSPKSTRPVAGRKPNAWGLYDMSGNVWEWCNDLSGNYDSVGRIDPTGPASVQAASSYRVLRGGAFTFDGPSYYVNDLRAAFRHDDFPGSARFCYGFRCVRR